MADDEEKQDEGQEERAEASKGGAKPASRADAAKSYLANAGRYWGHIMRTKWVAIILIVASLVLLLTLPVWGGVWSAAIKGFFGESLHDDVADDDQNWDATKQVRARSDTKLAQATTDRRINVDGIDYCQLVMPDRLDQQFYNGSYTFTRGAIGAPEGTTIKPDRRMVQTIEYLCRRHGRLGISHIISAYVNMYLDPEQLASRDPQIIQNISAHNRGQAYDLVEIDFVYKVFRFQCPNSPNWTIEYWNDRNQLLLTLPCREPLNNVNANFAGGPATAIPIRAIWQDQPNQFALGGLPLNVNSALATLAAYLGLPPQALQFANGSLTGMLTQIGQGYLEELLGLPAGSLHGNDLGEILQSAFDSKLAGLLGQLPRLSWGTTIGDLVRSTGAGWWEQVLGLFPGSLQGWNSAVDIFRSVGLTTAANALRLPPEVLLDINQAKQLLASLTAEDLASLAGDPATAQLAGVVNAIRNGDSGALNAALETYGQNILELTFAASPGSFGPCDPDAGGDRRIFCPNPFLGLAAVASRTGLDEATLRGFVQTILDNGSLAGSFEQRGAPLLEGALGLPAGTVAQLLAGQSVTFDQATIQQLASRFGVDTSAAQQLLAAISQGQNLVQSIQQMGSAILAQVMQLSDPTALYQIVAGTASAQLRASVEQELANLARSLNLPPELVQLSGLLSGNIASVLQSLAGIQLGDIFGLSVSQIQQLLSGNLSVLLNLPNFQALTQSILQSLGLNINQLTGLLNGNALLSQLSSIGNILNGAISTLGLDQWLIMERVYRPEARFKVHLVLRELLDMPITLDDIDLRVTQLITYSYERDVQPFEADGTLDKVYGAGRSRNFGLFAMKEAFDHLHIGY